MVLNINLKTVLVNTIIFQTYVNAMNEKIRRQISINNPFVFKHISNLKNIDQFQDIGESLLKHLFTYYY